MAQAVKNLPANAGDAEDSGWIPGKIPWRRKWQSTPVFLPGESHGQRSLVGYKSMSCKELDATEQLSTHTHTHTHHTYTHAHTFILYKNFRISHTGGTCKDTCLLSSGPFLALPFTQEMHIFPVAGGLSPLGLGSFPLSAFFPMSVPSQSHSGASATSARLEEGSLAQGQSG